MPYPSTISKLSALAEDQWGLLTRRQAEEAGMAPATLQRLTSDRSVLERVARGTYHLAGAPLPDHLGLRGAWLQLAPDTLAWRRGPEQGVVSHRSAATLYGLGELPADRHEFTMPRRHQGRRPDVRVHRAQLGDGDWGVLGGLPVTRPSRTAADLLAQQEDSEAVARIVSEALQRKNDWAGDFVHRLAPRAVQFGLRREDGESVLRWLLNLISDPQADRWLEQARQKAVEL